MKFLVILVLFFFFAKFDAIRYDLQGDVSRTITVSKNGRGQFSTVQQAIDSIPSNNAWWIRIHINHGVYNEKVTIPQDKPYIILEGNPNHLTTIDFGDAGSVVASPTFKAHADNFVAKNIVFKNTYDHLITLEPNGRKTTWAPAAAIDGDKASFYYCTFISLQDTLSDAQGRHYFYDCNIQGAIDFIWGNGQSIYEKCQITSLVHKLGQNGGYITAQGRERPEETTGFVFKDCHVCGSGPIMLGRAYRAYARVLFSGTYMENIITPQGWSEWQVKPVDSITFSEAKCSGPGADMSHRIPWEMKLSDEEVEQLTNTASFINQDGWLEKQPH
ncbi:probable pectinesterase 29 [Rosa rugosa]|uniref:probable pectinesterase 29 n=1 Tax=Rosa rugosa TaxID=74645 RepID=UPI002B400DC7|nr:probable pectinesterase 29 [Rosa rugosa]